MRKILEPARGGGNAYLLKQLRGAVQRGLAVEPEMQTQRFGELKADREARIEARGRILEDHRQILADDLAPFCVREARQVATGEADSLRAHPAREGDETEQGQH